MGKRSIETRLDEAEADGVEGPGIEILYTTAEGGYLDADGNATDPTPEGLTITIPAAVSDLDACDEEAR